MHRSAAVAGGRRMDEVPNSANAWTLCAIYHSGRSFNRIMERFFLLGLLFISNSSFSQFGISGHVYDLNTGKPLCGTRMTISTLESVKAHKLDRNSILFLVDPNRDSVYYDSSYQKLESIFTDSNGYYLFNCLDSNIYCLSAWFKTTELRPGIWLGESFDTTGIRFIWNSKIDISFALHVTCEYDSTKDLLDCPRCHKRDKVLPIAYGLTGFPQEPGYYYNGNCSPPLCHPTKRCMRCEYEF